MTKYTTAIIKPKAITFIKGGPFNKNLKQKNIVAPIITEPKIILYISFDRSFIVEFLCSKIRTCFYSAKNLTRINRTSF